MMHYLGSSGNKYAFCVPCFLTIYHLSLCDVFCRYCTVCVLLFETFLLFVFCHLQAVKSLKRNFSDFCMDGSARMKVCMLLILHICVVLILILHSLLSTFLAFVFC
jgi:hypothetical protein